MSNSLDPDEAIHNVRGGLSPSCLQKYSAFCYHKQNKCLLLNAGLYC